MRVETDPQPSVASMLVQAMADVFTNALRLIAQRIRDAVLAMAKDGVPLMIGRGGIDPERP